MLRFLGGFFDSWFDSWLSEIATLTWLSLALIGAIVEVSIPHFGFAFVSAASVLAAVAAYFGFGIIPQIGIFVVVLAVSLVGLRSRLVGYLGGQGVPSRTDPLVGKHGVVTHEIDTTLGSGRVNVGGEDWAARAKEPIGIGVKVRVVGADGIVLEVTRA
jgi:membrane protein implicated in regulation of membrane protease activity